MKIKSVVLGLSFFILSAMGQNDCEKFKTFFIRQNYVINDCCGNSRHILCDENNNIKSINLDASIMGNYDKPLSLSNFPNFENLVHFTISNEEDSMVNPLRGIFPSNLLDLPKLETLEITRIVINDISDNLNENSNLKTLKLRYCKLVKFPYQFRSLSQLTNLDLSNNLMSGSITEMIKEFETLKYLNLENNQFYGDIVIPDSLEHIKITNNKFSKFSEKNSFENIKYIEAVNNLFDNNILITLKQATQLKTLTLGNNIGISTIPDDIYLLNSLENLDLSNTRITVLPNNFFSLSNLHYLNLANNENLNPSIVNFGSQINVCDFTNTLISCYQPDTCTVVIGLTDSKDCNDYEIERLHMVNEEVNKFINKKSGTSFFKYLAIFGIAFVIIFVIVAGIFYIRRRSNKREVKRHSKIHKKMDVDIDDEDDDDESFTSVSLSVDENDSSVTPTIRNNHSSHNSNQNRNSYHSKHRNSYLSKSHNSSQNRNSYHSKHRSSYHSKAHNSYHSTKIHNSVNRNSVTMVSDYGAEPHTYNNSSINYSIKPTSPHPSINYSIQPNSPLPSINYNLPPTSPLPYSSGPTTYSVAPTVFSNIATVQSNVTEDDDDEDDVDDVEEEEIRTNKTSEVLSTYQLKDTSFAIFSSQNIPFNSQNSNELFSPSEITIDEKDTIIANN